MLAGGGKIEPQANGGGQIGQKPRAQPLGPFDDHPIRQRLVPAQFSQFGVALQPPQVEMMHGADAGGVALHQAEAGAWHIHRRVVREMAQQGAGKGGFSGPQPARQQQRVAGREAIPHGAGEGLGGGLAVELELG